MIDDDDIPQRAPDSLLARLRDEPARAPELIALAAAERHGPAARDWVAGRRGSPDRLAKDVKRIHARRARVMGGVTGIGGVLTMVPDMASAIWNQSRMVFFVAAAYGYDPLDPMRPAELLTLYELYDDPVQAREALDGAGRRMAYAAVDRALTRDDEQTLIAKLAGMVARRGAARLAGRAVPGFAILANAVGNERAVRELADRATAFYRG